MSEESIDFINKQKQILQSIRNALNQLNFIYNENTERSIVIEKNELVLDETNKRLNNVDFSNHEMIFHYVNDGNYSNRPTPEELGLMEEIFGEKSKVYEKQTGLPLFNGRIYGLKEIKIEDSKVHIYYEPSTYMTSVATKNPKYNQFAINGAPVVMPICALAILITSDNQILITNNNGEYKLPGGHTDINDLEYERTIIKTVADGKKIVLATILREITEEISKNLGIYQKKVIGVNIENYNYFTFVTLLKSNSTSEEISEEFRKRPGEDSHETGKIFFMLYTQENINKILSDPKASENLKIGFNSLLRHTKRNLKQSAGAANQPALSLL